VPKSRPVYLIQNHAVAPASVTIEKSATGKWAFKITLHGRSLAQVRRRAQAEVLTLKRWCAAMTEET
jgi:hypothetical protein